MTENMTLELCKIMKIYDSGYKHGLEDLPYIDAAEGKKRIHQAIKHAASDQIGTDVLGFMESLSRFTFVFYSKYLYQNDLNFPQRSCTSNSEKLNAQWIETHCVNDAIAIFIWSIDEWQPIERPVPEEVQEYDYDYVDREIDRKMNKVLRDCLYLKLLFILALGAGFILGKLF